MENIPFPPTSCPSVLIPVHNPPQSWASRLADRFLALSAGMPQKPKLWLVNDGSDRVDFDRGFQVLRRRIPDVELVQLASNKGKGAAIRAGLKHLRHGPVLVTDVDMPFATSSYWAVMMALSKGADVVFTRRPRAYLQDLPWLRRHLSRGFAAFTERISGKYARGDVQAGLKGLSQQGVARYLETTIPGYLADFEFALLLDAGLQVVAVETKMAQHHTQNLPVRLLLREMGFLARILIRQLFSRRYSPSGEDES